MRVAVAFGVCMILLSLFAGERGPAMWKAHREVQQIERDIAALKALNTALRERAQALREDGRTIEITARETLGLARPGEMVVVRRR